MKKLFDLGLFLYQHPAIRYIFSGGIAALTNLTLLYILVQIWHFHYLFSSVVSFLVGFVVTFVLQKYFTFREHTRERLPKQSILFFIMHMANLGLNTLLLYVSVELLHAHYLVAQIIILGLLAISSFFISKVFIFHKLSSVDTESQ